VLAVLLNAFCDWSFEVVLLSWGVFNLKAHFGGEVRARVALLGLDFELVGGCLFIS
tara:strand:+ start:2873 stop:3040 length:168 start_codon:yes stop_codon:yes gene_type:complete